MRLRWALRGLVLAGGGTVAALGMAGHLPMPAYTDPVEAREELANALQALKVGNASVAREHAIRATKLDPHWGLAQAVVARTDLVLGDGAAAQGALTRAIDQGFDPARAHHLRAHAFLLLGDPDQALAEARRTDNRYGGYATRIAALALANQGKLPAAQTILANLLKASNGTNAEGWADLARVRQMTGDLAGAAQAAGRAIAIDPKLVRAVVLRAELIRDQYGLIAALPWYQAALKIDPGDHDALIGYAATLGDAGRYAAMLAATRAAQVTQPSSPEALYLQAVLAARAGNVPLGRSLVARISGPLARQPGPLMLTAMLDYASGGEEQAIQHLRQVIGQQPMNIPARRLLGSALLKSGDWRGALDVLRPVALRGDADSYTLSLVGRSFEVSGQRDWASRFLDRAGTASLAAPAPFGTDDSLETLRARAVAAPGDPIAAVGYIRALIDAGQQSAALAQAQQLAKSYPGVPQAHLLVGDTLFGMGRYGDAASAYAHAADLRFDEPTMLRLVDAWDHSRQHEKAAAALALFLSQNPQNISAQRLAAHWQIAAGDWDAAIDTLEGLRARTGNRDAALLAELAAAYTGNGDVPAARLYAAAAYAIAPLNAAVVDAYGWALYQGGDNEPARQLLEKAVSLAPNHPGLRWHLAQVEADMGKSGEARANIQQALADPDFADRTAAAAVLKLLG